MILITGLDLLVFLLLLPTLAVIISINWFNSVFINLPIKIDTLDIFNYVSIIILCAVYLILKVYSKYYLQGNPNYIYFKYTYNTFFLSMLLLLASGNLITTLIAWEFLRITSFLLISYYTLRIKANKSSLKALIINKFEDFNIIFASVYIYNILMTSDNILINSLLFNYTRSHITIIRFLLIMSSLTKSAQVLFSV